MLRMAAADGSARWGVAWGWYFVIVVDSVGNVKVGRWGVIGGGGQNKKIICSTVLCSRSLNRFLFVGFPTRD